MKYSQCLAIGALLGAVQGFELVERTNQEKLFIQMKLQDDAIEDSNLLQTDKILEKAQGWGGWGPHMHEFPGTVNEFGNWVDAYDRKVPDRFVGDAAEDGVPPVDKFTQNLIENYAFEASTGPAKDGKTAWDAHHPLPSGTFFISKAQGKKLAQEILCTHFKKCGADGLAYLDSFSGD